MKTQSKLSTLGAALLFVGGSALCAEEGFKVHGSLSATASSSTEYDYLGDTKDTLDLNIIDIILNSTHRFDSGLRVGGQVYAYKLGDFEEITLDFANLDYSFHQAFGLRAGRNKLPHGLYNDSQDLDAIRTFASLPFSFYPRSLRAVEAAYDGAGAYGNIGLGGFGSLDYQVFYGAKQRISGSDNPLLMGLSASLISFDSWQFDEGVYGGTLFWNLPIDGLKVGYSYQYYGNSELAGQLGGTAQLRGSALAVPQLVDKALGKGAWDLSGKFAGTPASITGLDIAFRTLSAEYSLGKWIFAAEYKLLDLMHGTTTIPPFALLGMPTKSSYENHPEYLYGMVSYQATDKLGLGVYYSESVNNRNGDSSDPEEYSDDLCGAISYNVTDWCIVKAEAHLLKGYSNLSLSGDPMPAPGSKEDWQYFVLKTTLTF